eukprot:7392203-Alexandrium_andersonii.AAC.1
MAEVLQLLGDGGVELRPAGSSAPDALKLSGAGSEKGLHGRPSCTDGTALGLELGPGLIDKARNRRVGAFGQRPLRRLDSDQQGVDRPGHLR